MLLKMSICSILSGVSTSQPALQSPWNPSLNLRKRFCRFWQTHSKVWMEGRWDGSVSNGIATKHGTLSLSFQTHVVERANWFLQVVLWPQCTGVHNTHPIQYTYTYTPKMKFLSSYGKSKDQIANSITKEIKEIRGLPLSNLKTCYWVAEVSTKCEMNTNHFSIANN